MVSQSYRYVLLIAVSLLYWLVENDEILKKGNNPSHDARALHYVTFVFILHFCGSPAAGWCEAEPELYDEKNDGLNRKHVYADRAALTVLRES